MKVLILMIIVSSGHCLSPQRQNYEIDKLKGESYADYNNRKVESQIYNIPNGECYLDDESLNGSYCQVKIDSCCYTKHHHVCFPSFGFEGEVEGHCRKYRGHPELSFFFNGTLYDRLD